MKTKIFALAGLVVAMGTISCDKDDDKYTLPAATLTGKWYYSKVGGTLNGVEFLNDYNGNEDGCQKDYVEFTNNNVFTDADFDSSSAPCQLTADAGSYTVTGNTIVTNIQGEVGTKNILNLSFTELKVQDTEDNTIIVFTRN